MQEGLLWLDADKKRDLAAKVAEAAARYRFKFGVQPDVCYVGGLTRALRVAEMAHEAGLECVPHSANPSMVTVFTLHMMAAIPNAGPHVEFSIEGRGWTEGLFTPALEAVDGHVAVPQGPGWGITLAEQWLQSAEHEISELA